MFAGYKRSRGARRGVVLIVVLGMLGLLALIGVTFATFSAQARISARNFSMSQSFPDSRELMDFALSQLIDDTYNPVSAIRGHSLKRDMYGNDAAFNGYLAGRPDNGAPLKFISTTLVPTGPLAGLYACAMNIQYNDPAFYGYYDFTRWIVQFPGQVIGGSVFVGESFEVIADDYSGASSTARVLYLTPHDTTTTIPGVSSLIGAPSGATAVPFVLDGRYLRAFNGPGLSALVYPSGSSNPGVPANVYGNFRLNGGLLNGLQGKAVPTLTPMGDPNAVGMDEDYDACDLDNWFLAIQSADGQVVIPSFHRPAIIRADESDNNNAPNNGNTAFNGATDWNLTGADSMARILRPRTKDGHSALSFPDLLPNANGRITYDVDNDGDGVTDSVWLDLGYPAKRDSTGQLFKPLFSFLVVGLNGRLPLNTAGNIQLRDNESSATSYPSPQPSTPPAFAPLYAHAGRLGYSPSEIDICYALQNAADPTGTLYSQQDNGGLFVNLTQLRNILTGTRPQINPYVAPGAYPNNGLNQDTNFVAVNGQPFYMPNNVADSGDANPYGGTTGLVRATPDVSGRWGESDYIPGPANNPVALSGNPASPPATPYAAAAYNFASSIRAGLSLSYGPVEDDNFTQFDPTGRNTDTYDAAGGLGLPVERFRRFTTPLDISGNGMLTAFNTASGTPIALGFPPFGNGPDALGRVGYYLYYRPSSYPTVYLTPLPGNNKASTAPPDNTTNPYHGYDSAFNPLVTGTKFGGAANNATAMGAADGRGGGNNPLGNNEADEMRLYTPSEYDKPFDVADLQWLYRSQDSDGASLTSRLAQLAPVSFLNPKDGTRRRRLFALDTWETTNFVWTPDNPGGAFPDNSRFGTFPNPNNQTTPPGSPVLLPYTANASFANLNLTTAVINNINASNIPYPFGYFSPLAPYGAQNQYAPANTGVTFAYGTDPSPAWPARTPPLAHRDRKINLNYPLPISNEPDEPVRKKWIANTYDMLKSVLPPLSIDTPAELAQLSQFVINIVDFRDPDATMTHWVNPDVQIVPPTSGAGGGTPPQLVLTSAGVGGAVPLDQYGMEYQPVAINEVLAYSFLRKDYDTASMQSVARPTNRFFVELVNTLTQSATGPTSGVNAGTLNIDPTDAYSSGNLANPGAPGTPTGLDLTNWDLVITEDTPYARPDPTTGQLLGTPYTLNNGVYGPIAINQNSLIDFKTATPPATVTQPVHIPALTNATAVPPAPAANPGSATAGPGPQTQYAWNYYFVVGNLLPVIATSPKGGTGQQCENKPPLVTNATPDQMVTFIDGTTATTKTLTETDLFDSYAASSAGGSLLTNSDQAATAPDNTLVDKKNSSTKLYQVPQIASNASKYMWVYLRRPANPFAASGTSPMVVVDCMRFAYMEGGGTITQAQISQTDYGDGDPTTKKVTPGTNQIYSTQRLQPFRGGHAVGVLPANGNDIITAYGFSEQTMAATSMSTNANAPNYGVFGNQQFTANIYHTLGQPNTPNPDTTWEYFPFHDRDFASVAELLLVPGCPPGLFTKQFVENTSANFLPPTGVSATPAPPAGGQLTAGPRAYPYLKDNFFYTAASPAVLNPNAGVSGPYWPQTGGPAGAGWHKMLEFFEVPSAAFGAIGPVATGFNYDWARQDTKPGLLNLNLIIDEEVWLGLMGNAGLMNSVANLASIPMLHSNQMVTPGTETGQAVQNQVPKVVTLTDRSGAPYQYNANRLMSYPMSNVGFFAPDPGNAGNPDNRMKAAFNDFLKLRHGGSGYMFAWGTGPVGASPIAGATFSPAAERPFRSLSFPDIDFTVMRPAALPPSTLTSPTWTGPLTAATQPPNFAWDPGVKNPYLVYSYMPAMPPGDGYPNSHGSAVPPPIPPRRLFQIPDAGSTGPGPSSNASLLGDINLNNLIVLPTLVNQNFDLTAGAPVYFSTAGGDNRRHPYYRTEWLQKIMNLTTVRTHQYAVWITIAFFQVSREGDPSLAADANNFTGAYDILGDELNISTGRNTRYRSFFLLDRTRATGFNPGASGDFRNVVVYRQSIE